MHCKELRIYPEILSSYTLQKYVHILNTPTLSFIASVLTYVRELYIYRKFILMTSDLTHGLICRNNVFLKALQNYFRFLIYDSHLSI